MLAGRRALWARKAMVVVVGGAIATFGACSGAEIETVDVSPQAAIEQSESETPVDGKAPDDALPAATAIPVATTAAPAPTAIPVATTAAPEATAIPVATTAAPEATALPAETATSAPAATPVPRLGGLVPPPQPHPDPTPTPELSSPMAAFRGSDTATAIGRAIRNRLILQLGCPGADIPAEGLPLEPNSFDVWNSNDVRRLIDVAPPAVAEPLLSYLEAQDAADAACNRDRAAWVTGTRDAMLALGQVEAAIGTTPDTALPMLREADYGADVTALTADMAAMYDRIYAALNNVSDMQASDFWFSATHYAHLRGRRDLLASGGAPPTIVVVGDSVSARGIDSAVLTADVGRPTVNYSQFSAYPEGIIEFLPQVIGQADPETIIWVIYPHQIYTRGCAEQQRIAIDPFRKPLVLQGLAFAPVDWLASTPTLDLLFGGSQAARSYGGTQLQHKADDLHDPWIGRAGSPFVHVGIDEPRIERQIAASISRYENPEACDLRYTAIDAAFGDLAEQGHRVIAVVPPTSERLAALHPDGWAGHDDVVADLQGISTSNNAELVDLSRSLDDQTLFHDLVHVNARGREAFTTEIAAYLSN